MILEVVASWGTKKGSWRAESWFYQKLTSASHPEVLGQFLILYEKIMAEYSVLISFLFKIIITQAFHIALILLLPLFNHSRPHNKQQ